ncbi:MAG TPA: sugar ABC transporter ATP-binding protein [Aggregatilineales bacterium]|nr:sugar ABC transporter ATP-binding protein [Aggregatilineales bacterium]
MSDSLVTPLLQLNSISKGFPGVQALQDVNLTLQAGEVHALVGENGAGKSTLLKILFGVYQPDAGQILIDGKPVEINSPKAANRAGIAMIHQELQQVPELNAAQNIFLGQPATRAGIFKDTRAMRETARDLLHRLKADVDVSVPVRTLSVAQRQIVEIARALLGNARIIAMDEPTSSLTPTEFDHLIDVIRDLRAHGVGIIYVSHRLNELFEIADRATVLRDGRFVGTVNMHEIDQPGLVRMMVGRELANIEHTSNATPRIVLKVSDLSWGERIKNVSFELRQGEILGISGLVGAGRTEMVRLIAGLYRPTQGSIMLHGKPMVFKNPRQAINAGIGLLPEDRKKQGILPLLPVSVNTSLPVLGRFKRLAFIDNARRHSTVRAVVNQVNLRPPNIARPIRNFSGGNQQKAIVARWLVADSDILIFDEPTRGIDIGAKQEIYTMIEQLAATGKAILMVSSELPEILRLSDRVLVMRGGEVTATLTREELSEEKIMHYAIPGV